MENEEQRNIGHGYELLNQIGEGPLSSVYRVYNKKYDLHFAGKLIKVKPGNEQQIKKYIENELTALQGINHPNVIRIYDHFKEGNTYIMIYESCAGGNLQNRIEIVGKLVGQSLLTISKQILLAINSVHQNNYAHLDIRPSNILFDEHDRPKLSNFKMSVNNKDDKIVDSYDYSLQFKAPEVLKRQQFVPEKADIWALGILFYFMVTGRMPFEGNTREELIVSIESSPVQLPEDVPADYARSVRSMLNLNPAQRPVVSYLLRESIFVGVKTPNSVVTGDSRKLSKVYSVASSRKNIRSVLHAGSKLGSCRAQQCLTQVFKCNTTPG